MQSFHPTDKHSSFLVWDDEGTPPEGEWVTVLWQSFNNDDCATMHSFPKLIEEHADALRPRYLAWIYDLGESQIKGKRLVDHLELRPGFSYWWMTLIAEKCNVYKSLQIFDVLKLLALEELVVTHSVSSIILMSNNKALTQAFRLWCKNAGLVFELRPLLHGRENLTSWIRRLYHLLPQPVLAVILLVRYICQRWPLRERNGNQNAGDNGEITFVDYLIHLDQKALTTGRFASNFWADMVDALDRSESKVNWIHHHIQHEAVSSTKQARDLIAHFNQRGMGRQYHTCLDGPLGIPVLLAVLRDYIRLACMSLRLTTIRGHFRPVGSKLDFWPLFKQDWLSSMRGPTAILNCLGLNLFERTIRRLPRQKLGVYLQENQGWEMAFIHAWRAGGHGRLIGVAHSTVRYWDLRYFFDPRNYRRTGKNDLPLPDKVALNGPAALAAYRKGGYPADQMVEVEALRYLNIADLPRIANELRTGPLCVLVLGDYMPAVTRRQIQCLSDAMPLLPPDTHYVVKPHPSCPVKPSDYPSLQLQMSSCALPELLSECDVVYTSNITSAAVDAYCAGVPVISALDGQALNMSPLRGLHGVVYVTNPSELADALRNARNRERVIAEPYFCLDKVLLRWRKLLGLNSADAEQVVGT